MSVLIRGMEMPKDCSFCPMRLKVDPDTILCQATGERFEETFTATIEMRNGGKCPLVELPTPHGRLVDADELIAEHNGIFDCCVFPSDIREAPTILEAEP